MSDPSHSLTGYRILVVEDEYFIAMSVKNWLQTAGAQVVGPVSNVDQALDLIEDKGPDVAVLDINLGYGKTVYPVADRLSVLGVPYLFATGDVEVSRTDGYRERPRLNKPYSEADLVRALTDLTG